MIRQVTAKYKPFRIGPTSFHTHDRNHQFQNLHLLRQRDPDKACRHSRNPGGAIKKKDPHPLRDLGELEICNYYFPTAKLDLAYATPTEICPQFLGYISWHKEYACTGREQAVTAASSRGRTIYPAHKVQIS